MNYIRLIAALCLFLLSLSILAEEIDTDKTNSKDLPTLPIDRPNVFEKHYHYEYKDRDHTFKESAQHVGVLFGLNIFGYYLSQPDEVRENGSFEKYEENFGDIVFDKDAPFWNLMTHPLVGSQVYLYYRGFGYSPQRAFLMTAIQSTIFEFTIEIYTEPASVQDLYQTPVLGSLLGFGIEKLSMRWLNSDSQFLRTMGHIMNPWTLFSFFEGKSSLTPTFMNGRPAGLMFTAEF